MLSPLLLLLAALLRPSSARCPRGTWLDLGVRASGEYRCAALTPEQWRRGDRGGWVDAGPAPRLELDGRVYCDGGRAVTEGGQTVHCTEARS